MPRTRSHRPPKRKKQSLENVPQTRRRGNNFHMNLRSKPKVRLSTLISTAPIGRNSYYSNNISSNLTDLESSLPQPRSVSVSSNKPENRHDVSSDDPLNEFVDSEPETEDKSTSDVEVSPTYTPPDYDESESKNPDEIKKWKKVNRTEKSETNEFFVHHDGYESDDKLQVKYEIKHAKPIAFPNRTSFVDLVQNVLSPPLVRTFIRATNEHGKTDTRYTLIPERTQDGLAFIYCFFALIIYCNFSTTPFDLLWCTESSSAGNPIIAQAMSRERFMSVKRHFCAVIRSFLPSKSNNNYHPTQNVLKAIQVMRRNGLLIIILGNISAIDEGRIKSSSPGDGFATRNPSKPIKKGRDFHVVAQRLGEFRGFAVNTLIYAGKKTYTNTAEPKMLNIIDQLLDDELRKIPGHVIVIDNRYNSIVLCERDIEWGIGVIGTIRKNIKGLSKVVKNKDDRKPFHKYIETPTTWFL